MLGRNFFELFSKVLADSADYIGTRSQPPNYTMDSDKLEYYKEQCELYEEAWQNDQKAGLWLERWKKSGLTMDDFEDLSDDEQAEFDKK